MPGRPALFLALPLPLLAANCVLPQDVIPPQPISSSTAAAPSASAAAQEDAESCADGKGDCPAKAGAKTVAISGSTACAVSGGRVFCWGDNSRQVIADGSKGPRPTPVAVGGIEKAVSVALGRHFGCAVASTGKAYCFREGSARELSLVSDIADLAISDTSVIIAKKNGSIVGLDLGYTAQNNEPKDVPDLKDIIAVGAGQYHTCALHKGGEVSCWGDPEYTGSGIDTSEMDYETREKIMREPVKIAGLSDATSLSLSETHSCVTRKTKQIVCWGSNWSGELGDGSTERKDAPVTVQLIDDATQVTTGAHHSCARRSTGKVVCWGESHSGQLGSGNPGTRGMAEVVSIEDATYVAAGEEVSCAALAKGGVMCWGAASRGRLGNGTVSDYVAPQPVAGISGAKSVVAGDKLSCAIDAANHLLCWGEPGFRSDTPDKRKSKPEILAPNIEVSAAWLRESTLCVLGKDKKTFCDSPSSFLKDPREVKLGTIGAIAASGSFGAVLSPSGQVQLWQREWEKPDNVQKQTLGGLSGAVAIAMDSGVVCAVKRTGKVACVGYSYKTFDKKEPLRPTSAVEVPDIRDAVGIAAGGGDTCVLRKTGEISCFSSFRVPGPVDPKAPSRTGKPLPIEVRPVKGMNNAVDLTITGGVRCALLKDSTVSCWGSNTYGQLGTGDYEFHWEPVPVAGLTGVTQVATGGYQVCAAKKSGEIVCWGRNTSDEAGQSAPPYAYSPVPVLLPQAP